MRNLPSVSPKTKLDFISLLIMSSEERGLIDDILNERQDLGLAAEMVCASEMKIPSINYLLSGFHFLHMTQGIQCLCSSHFLSLILVLVCVQL